MPAHALRTPQRSQASGEELEFALRAGVEETVFPIATEDPESAQRDLERNRFWAARIDDQLKELATEELPQFFKEDATLIDLLDAPLKALSLGKEEERRVKAAVALLRRLEPETFFQRQARIEDQTNRLRQGLYDVVYRLNPTYVEAPPEADFQTSESAAVNAAWAWAARTAYALQASGGWDRPRIERLRNLMGERYHSAWDAFLEQEEGDFPDLATAIVNVFYVRAQELPESSELSTIARPSTAEPSRFGRLGPVGWVLPVVAVLFGISAFAPMVKEWRQPSVPLAALVDSGTQNTAAAQNPETQEEDVPFAKAQSKPEAEPNQGSSKGWQPESPAQPPPVAQQPAAPRAFGVKEKPAGAAVIPGFDPERTVSSADKAKEYLGKLKPRSFTEGEMPVFLPEGPVGFKKPDSGKPWQMKFVEVRPNAWEIKATDVVFLSPSRVAVNPPPERTGVKVFLNGVPVPPGRALLVEPGKPIRMGMKGDGAGEGPKTIEFSDEKPSEDGIMASLHEGPLSKVLQDRYGVAGGKIQNVKGVKGEVLGAAWLKDQELTPDRTRWEWGRAEFRGVVTGGPLEIETEEGEKYRLNPGGVLCVAVARDRATGNVTARIDPNQKFDAAEGAKKEVAPAIGISVKNSVEPGTAKGGAPPLETSAAPAAPVAQDRGAQFWDWWAREKGLAPAAPAVAAERRASKTDPGPGVEITLSPPEMIDAYVEEHLTPGLIGWRKPKIWAAGPVELKVLQMTTDSGNLLPPMWRKTATDVNLRSPAGPVVLIQHNIVCPIWVLQDGKWVQAPEDSFVVVEQATTARLQMEAGRARVSGAKILDMESMHDFMAEWAASERAQKDAAGGAGGPPPLPKPVRDEPVFNLKTLSLTDATPVPGFAVTQSALEISSYLAQCVPIPFKGKAPEVWAVGPVGLNVEATKYAPRHAAIFTGKASAPGQEPVETAEIEMKSPAGPLILWTPEAEKVRVVHQDQSRSEEYGPALVLRQGGTARILVSDGMGNVPKGIQISGDVVPLRKSKPGVSFVPQMRDIQSRIAYFKSQQPAPEQVWLGQEARREAGLIVQNATSEDAYRQAVAHLAQIPVFLQDRLLLSLFRESLHAPEGPQRDRILQRFPKAYEDLLSARSRKAQTDLAEAQRKYAAMKRMSEEAADRAGDSRLRQAHKGAAEIQRVRAEVLLKMAQAEAVQIDALRRMIPALLALGDELPVTGASLGQESLLEMMRRVPPSPDYPQARTPEEKKQAFQVFLVEVRRLLEQEQVKLQAWETLLAEKIRSVDRMDREARGAVPASEKNFMALLQAFIDVFSKERHVRIPAQLELVKALGADPFDSNAIELALKNLQEADLAYVKGLSALAWQTAEQLNDNAQRKQQVAKVPGAVAEIELAGVQAGRKRAQGRMEQVEADFRFRSALPQLGLSTGLARPPGMAGLKKLYDLVTSGGSGEGGAADPRPPEWVFQDLQRVSSPHPGLSPNELLRVFGIPSSDESQVAPWMLKTPPIPGPAGDGDGGDSPVPPGDPVSESFKEEQMNGNPPPELARWPQLPGGRGRIGSGGAGPASVHRISDAPDPKWWWVPPGPSVSGVGEWVQPVPLGVKEPLPDQTARSLVEGLLNASLSRFAALALQLEAEAEELRDRYRRGMSVHRERPGAIAAIDLETFQDGKNLANENDGARNFLRGQAALLKTQTDPENLKDPAKMQPALDDAWGKRDRSAVLWWESKYVRAQDRLRTAKGRLEVLKGLPPKAVSRKEIQRFQLEVDTLQWVVPELEQWIILNRLWMTAGYHPRSPALVGRSVLSAEDLRYRLEKDSSTRSSKPAVTARYVAASGGKRVRIFLVPEEAEVGVAEPLYSEGDRFWERGVEWTPPRKGLGSREYSLKERFGVVQGSLTGIQGVGPQDSFSFGRVIVPVSGPVPDEEMDNLRVKPIGFEGELFFSAAPWVDSFKLKEVRINIVYFPVSQLRVGTTLKKEIAGLYLPDWSEELSRAFLLQADPLLSAELLDQDSPGKTENGAPISAGEFVHVGEEVTFQGWRFEVVSRDEEVSPGVVQPVPHFKVLGPAKAGTEELRAEAFIQDLETFTSQERTFLEQEFAGLRARLGDDMLQRLSRNAKEPIRPPTSLYELAGKALGISSKQAELLIAPLPSTAWVPAQSVCVGEGAELPEVPEEELRNLVENTVFMVVAGGAGARFRAGLPAPLREQAQNMGRLEKPAVPIGASGCSPNLDVNEQIAALVRRVGARNVTVINGFGPDSGPAVEHDYRVNGAWVRRILGEVLPAEQETFPAFDPVTGLILTTRDPQGNLRILTTPNGTLGNYQAMYKVAREKGLTQGKRVFVLYGDEAGLADGEKGGALERILKYSLLFDVATVSTPKLALKVPPGGTRADLRLQDGRTLPLIIEMAERSSAFELAEAGLLQGQPPVRLGFNTGFVVFSERAAAAVASLEAPLRHAERPRDDQSGMTRRSLELYLTHGLTLAGILPGMKTGDLRVDPHQYLAVKDTAKVAEAYRERDGKSRRLLLRRSGGDRVTAGLSVQLDVRPGFSGFVGEGRLVLDGSTGITLSSEGLRRTPIREFVPVNVKRPDPADPAREIQETISVPVFEHDQAELLLPANSDGTITLDRDYRFTAAGAEEIRLPAGATQGRLVILGSDVAEGAIASIARMRPAPGEGQIPLAVIVHDDAQAARVAARLEDAGLVLAMPMVNLANHPGWTEAETVVDIQVQAWAEQIQTYVVQTPADLRGLGRWLGLSGVSERSWQNGVERLRLGAEA